MVNKKYLKKHNIDLDGYFIAIADCYKNNDFKNAEIFRNKLSKYQEFLFRIFLVNNAYCNKGIK